MTDKEEVTKIVRDFLRAVETGDRRGIAANHSDDLLMFDFPDTVEGIADYEKTWDFFYDNQNGPITFSPDRLETTVGDQVAFVACIVHCTGTEGGDFRFRLTVGLEKRDGLWTIVHEHHSLPTKDERYVMPEKHAELGVGPRAPS
jgi:ketosteroid isomerase-like protein